MKKTNSCSKSENYNHSSASHPVRIEPYIRRTGFSKKAFSPRSNGRASELSVAGEGYHKLKTKLISHGLPETVVSDLIEHHTPVMGSPGTELEFAL